MGSLGTSERSTTKQTGGASGKESASNAGDERDLGSTPGSGRCPGEGHGFPPTPVFLTGESLGQRNPVGYSP